MVWQIYRAFVARFGQKHFMVTDDWLTVAKQKQKQVNLQKNLFDDNHCRTIKVSEMFQLITRSITNQQQQHKDVGLFNLHVCIVHTLKCHLMNWFTAFQCKRNLLGLFLVLLILGFVFIWFLIFFCCGSIWIDADSVFKTSLFCQFTTKLVTI